MFFPTIFTRERTFMTSCLLPWTKNLFQIGWVPTGTNSFLYELTPKLTPTDKGSEVVKVPKS